MGFYSFLTADTMESIPVVASQRPMRTVYLLQPDGMPPIAEHAYEGRGVFGGVECYEWVARMNLPKDVMPADAVLTTSQDPEGMRVMDDDQLHALGLSMCSGIYFEDPATKARFCIFHEGPSLIDPTIELHRIRYSEPVPGYGRSANAMVADGTIVSRHFEVARPLKLSYDPEARYEDLLPSQDCPHQGFFYPYEEDEDEDEDEDDHDDDDAEPSLS